MASRNKKPSRKVHPAQRFAAPSSIETGRPLKELIGPQLVELIAESIADVYPDFAFRRFIRTGSAGLDELELKQRAAWISKALYTELPQDFIQAALILISSFGPPLISTTGNGLGVFFYYPHSDFIATAGIGNFSVGMQANLELTQRFSAEFSIRPYLERYPTQSLSLLKKWAKSSNPHVRRLVSEGTRPRLPWASRLRVFEKTPKATLELLELLKDDPELYVRRSVANHLGDLLKDHPELLYGVCARWLREVSGKSISATTRSHRHWIVRHALRLPAKNGDRLALELRIRAK